MTRGAVLSLFLTYAVGLYDLSQTSRSNAREVASAVASLTQPGDLMIVTPEWLASSFNRYYLPPVEQIDYPHFGREHEIDFSGMLDRLTDDSAASQVRERITEARKQNRRVWLVVDRDDHLVASPAEMGRFLESANYGMIAFARTNQLHAQLDTLYGSPDTSIYVASLPPRNEDIHAFLYTPGDKNGH